MAFDRKQRGDGNDDRGFLRKPESPPRLAAIERKEARRIDAVADHAYVAVGRGHFARGLPERRGDGDASGRFAQSAADRKSTRLNSSHITISYAVFCLKKKK